MPARKPTGKTKIPKIKKAPISFFDYLRFGESYTSLILGIIVVIVATVLLLSFVHNKQARKATITPTSIPVEQLAKPSPTVTPTPTNVPQKELTSGGTYTVVAGDNLWLIAEKVYKSGYNWVDIAKTNNLADPGDIHVGNKLILPKVAPKIATVTKDPTSVTEPTPMQSTKVTGTTYIVVHGDTLWNIAVRAYGDGYQWMKIANANGLAQPNLIHVGNVLKIPRN